MNYSELKEIILKTDKRTLQSMLLDTLDNAQNSVELCEDICATYLNDTFCNNFNIEDIKVIRTNTRDIDSVNIVIHIKDKEIGYGHINNRTNFAHVTLDNEDAEMENYIEHAIEERTIKIN